ncbi:hypothetical protein AB0L14_28285 [Streptomyces sp. NPDC052727]|uniref:hypothetical protein n=1 Tax=Streptomyces sp. NPDC052727 TaxID=3154854 RepID=UPI0034185CDF
MKRALTALGLVVGTVSLVPTLASGASANSSPAGVSTPSAVTAPRSATGPATSPAADQVCATASGAEGCFVKYGDKFTVADTKSDGYSAAVSWDNYLWDGSHWRLYRSGGCYNSAGAGTTGFCNYDFYENTSTNAYGAKGSKLVFQACTYNSPTDTVISCGAETTAVNDG